jgi:protoporphyrinogen oxidase
MDKTDIVIIGAGIAGITSAYYLQKKFPNIKI